MLVEVKGGIVKAILVEITIGKFVGRLMFVIIWKMLLDCIVSKVNSSRYFSDCELLRSCPDVSLFVPEELKTAIHFYSQHVASDIKLSLLIQ